METNKISRYEEKKQHGTPMLPFVIYGTIMPVLYSQFALHCHEEFEIIMSYNGECKYTIAGEEVRISSNDILIIMPWVLHKFRLENSKDFFFSETILGSINMINNSSVDVCSSKYFSPILNGNCSNYCIIRSYSKYYYEFHKIISDMINSYFRREEFYELKLKCLVGQLCHKLLKYEFIKVTEENTSKNDIESVRKVIDFIAENYKEHITLEMLAKIANISETRLSRLFRSSTGMSCIDYVIEHRLSNAVTLLRDSNMSIIEIAFETGFNNISYFNRTFKKHFGQTPTEYRKNKSGIPENNMQ